MDELVLVSVPQAIYACDTSNAESIDEQEDKFLCMADIISFYHWFID